MMGTHLVHRPARVTRGLLDEEPRVIEAPPVLPDGSGGSMGTALLPVLGVMSSVMMMTMLRSSQYVVIGAVIMVVTVLGSMALLFSQKGRAQRERRTQRERYLGYLESLREEFGAGEQNRREVAHLLDPAPQALWGLARDPARRWERRRGDVDFLRVRLGTGRLQCRPLTLSEPGAAITPVDPFMNSEARALISRYGTAADLPLTVPLDRVGNVSVVGERGDVLKVARLLLAQLSVAHAPDDLRLGLAAGPDRIADWEWMKWLPHVLDPGQRDGPGAARLMARNPFALAQLLIPEMSRRATFAAQVRRGMGGQSQLALGARLLVILDTHGQTSQDLPVPDEAVPLQDLSMTVVHLVQRRIDEPGQVAVRISVHPDGTVTIEDLRHPEAVLRSGCLDVLSPAEAEGLARMIAPLRLSADSTDNTPAGGPVDVARLLRVDDPAALDVPALWSSSVGRSFLRVPIGVDSQGEPVLLDLKEPAQLGMGPHGLCVGATGSGKSELLRTLLLALVSSHSPDVLSMVLVDFKGGATFAPFESLPHVAGVITNLQDDAGMIERAHSSLAGEIQRRQQVLRDAGNLAGVADYAAHRAERPALEPLPHLLVVIDEFGELLTARPDFIELFLSIGRIGRSIGVHLLLSSQRIESGKLKGLETYLSYRLGLRTFSAEESRTVLDNPDAFHLPPLPGHGYLKVDTSTYTKFTSAYVSEPCSVAAPPDDEATAFGVDLYPAYGDGRLTRSPAVSAGEPMPVRSTVATFLDVMVRQLSQAASPCRRIWLEPMPAVLTLDGVAGTVRMNEDGLGVNRRGRPMLVPIGVLDDPARQIQSTWRLDLTQAGGHCAVIGGPQSGKTTALRTLMLSLALTHTPREIALYALDLVGGGLTPLAGLPHVGGVAGRGDRERVRRTVQELRNMLTVRENAFREHSLDSVGELRRAHAAGQTPELAAADVVLVIDGFGALRGDFEEVDADIAELLQRGGGYGIHVVAGMLRWNDVRIATQSMFGTKLELRLNDPSESTVDRRLAGTIRPDQPGRALMLHPGGKLFGQIALPRVDGIDDDGAPGVVIEQIARAVRAAGMHPPVPQVRVLPHHLSVAELPGGTCEVPIGLDETALAPVLLDLFRTDQHLLVLGDGACGKTNLLRHIARSLAARHGPEELVLAFMDPRRGLRAIVPEDYIGGYASNSKVCGGLAAGIAKELQKRMPDEISDQQALAEGGWFSGPRIVLLVDDYDILTTAGQQPLEAFLPYLPSAPDIGLHVVVARRVAGASRALFDPFLTTLRESGTSGLVMTGDRSEGQLFPGVYAAERVPGRGVWVRRGEPARLIQTAQDAPADQSRSLAEEQ